MRVCVCREVGDGAGVGASDSRQNGRKEVGGGWGEINRQLNWKVAEREGEVRSRLLETKEKSPL